jgi:deoxyribonuclease-4
MKNLLIGTAGVPASAVPYDTEGGIRWLKKNGLDVMEIAWVRRVTFKEERARSVRKTARGCGIALTAHGSYYINLNSPDRDKVEASRNRILDAARMGELSGVRSLVFHCGYYGSSRKGAALKKVIRELKKVQAVLEDEGLEIELRPETTGKLSVIGTLKEIIEICNSMEGVHPCIDFAHLYARSGGKLNHLDGFLHVLDQVKEGLGVSALSNLHIHVAGITFGPRGERKHQFLEESTFDYLSLLMALSHANVRGYLICESPVPERDARLLKRTYEGVLRGNIKERA